MENSTFSITINPASADTKHNQIVKRILEGISSGELVSGSRLPSINQVCKSLQLSRDTVVSAYSNLKRKGIVSSAPGKGFFIEHTTISTEKNIFVLFDEINSFKEDLYNSFINNLDDNSRVDIYFHHFNRKLFDKLIYEANGRYTTYIIMPAQFRNTLSQLEKLNGTVIILDQLPPELTGRFTAIYQNFEKDMFDSLTTGKALISRYHKFIMVYPGGKEPVGQYLGFRRFCQENNIAYEIINHTEGRDVKRGEVYLVVWDRHLVWIMQESRERGLLPGRDVGIISFNDSALKQVVGNGVTTISTDFKAMGKTLAHLIHAPEHMEIENPASLIIRGSL